MGVFLLSLVYSISLACIYGLKLFTFLEAFDCLLSSNRSDYPLDTPSLLAILDLFGWV